VKTLEGQYLVWLCTQVRIELGTRFLAKEEDIIGPYKFGVYDVLVLPPSFPYGGMVSPTNPFPMVDNFR
jgi:hypothetical protein